MEESNDKKNGKPHIALLNVWRVVQAKGGTEKVFCDMANALIRRGYEVTLLFCDPNQGSPGFYVDAEVRCVNSYRESIFEFLYRNPWKNLRCFRFDQKKRKILRETLESRRRAGLIGESIKLLPKVDLFVSFQAESTWILREYLKVKTPVITMFHSRPSYYFGEQKFSIFRDAVGKSEALQVLLPEFEKEVKEQFPSQRVVIIPNVAPQYVEKSDLSSKIIMTMARVSPEKRPDLLIYSFALIKDQFPDWKCEWYGEYVDEEYLAQLRELIRSKGLEGRFLFPGKIDCVPEKLRQAAIFAFPSAFEGFGFAMAEAFSMGIPVVGCSDCTAVNSIVNSHVNGLLVDPRPECYAMGLKFLMENDVARRQYGTQGREDMKKYSSNVVWGAWDRLIREFI